MNKIIINRGSFKLDEIEFEQGTITIGRSTDNTISLDDNAVSGHHAKIVTVFHTSYIEDLDSTNGTQVNGKGVQKKTLHSGDVLSLGNHQLLFQSDAVKRTSQTSDTLLLRGSEIKKKLDEFMQAQAEMQEKLNSQKEVSAPNSTNTATTDQPSSDLSSTIKTIQENNQAWMEARNRAKANETIDDNKKAAPPVSVKEEIKNDAQKPRAPQNPGVTRKAANTENPKPQNIAQNSGNPKPQFATTQTIPAQPTMQSIPAQLGIPAPAAQKRRSGDTGYKRGAKKSRKVLPMLWVLIVTVLIGEIIYLTYRSIS